MMGIKCCPLINLLNKDSSKCLNKQHFIIILEERVFTCNRIMQLFTKTICLVLVMKKLTTIKGKNLNSIIPNVKSSIVLAIKLLRLILKETRMKTSIDLH